jgi:diguanylate cyclase (GGDEF)-like protein
MLDKRSLPPLTDSVAGSARFDFAHKALFVFGLIAPQLTFVIAISDLTVSQKTTLLVGLGIGYAAICFALFLWSRSRATDVVSDNADNTALDPQESELTLKLLALEEANQFFGSSLKSEDMFRLVSSRVNEIVPFTVSALFVLDEGGQNLVLTHASGKTADKFEGTEDDISSGLAGMSLLSGEVEFDVDLSLEKRSARMNLLSGLSAAAAVPLIHDGLVFAVFQIYTAEPIKPDPQMRSLLEALGERIAPLLLGSRAFDRTLANALTDPLTDLPNERALFMVLENQLAESQRFRDERPLSVLAIDIKEFEEVNGRLGHSTGDRLLKFAGDILKQSLRKMDFLSRAVNDEFTIVLPTATEKTALEIIERIREEFVANVFPISEHETVKIWLNFGWATFWTDGESAEQLLRTARLRKQQAKSADPGNVLWFKKEYVN